MQSFRLKNIIIVILALMNLFLLGSLASRRTAERAAQDQTRTQLAALFAADGVTLPPDIVTFQSPPAGGTLTRNGELDRQIAALFLGAGLTHSDQGGGIDTYGNAAGAAVFRSSGSFDLASRLDAEVDAEALCRKFCKNYPYDTPTFLQTETGAVGDAAGRFNGYPVVNCTVEFTISDDQLTVSGTHLPELFTQDTGASEPLSAVTALTTLLAEWRETAAVVSAVTDIYPCYELQSTTAAPMTLVPAWCIRTDAASYYVNCYTGSVTHG